VAVGFSLADAVVQPHRGHVPIPKIALPPLLILWLGIGEAPSGGGGARRLLPDGHQHLLWRPPGRPLLIWAAVSFEPAVERDPQGHPALGSAHGLRRLAGAGHALLCWWPLSRSQPWTRHRLLILQSGNLMETTKLMVASSCSPLGVLSHWGPPGSSARVVRWRHT
jgi:hypothetical protein